MNKNIPKNSTLALTPEEVIIFSLSKLIHIVKIHDDSNQLVINSALDFIHSINTYSDNNEPIKVEASRDRFYIQDEKLLHRNETMSVIQSLLNFFQTIEVSGFILSGPIDHTHERQVITFARILNQAIKKENPVYWISFSIEQMGLRWIKIITIQKKDTGYDIEEVKFRARKIYSYAYNSIHDVTRKIATGKRVGIRKSVRIVQDLADMVINEDPVLLGLSTIKDYDNYTYAHSVNVSILSMCLGQKIGLSKKSLVRLGICGLFHDIGKVDIDVDIINKPGKLTDNEFTKIQEHSLNSVRQILRLQTFRDLKAQIILPPFEHHLKYDLSGYPKVNWTKPVSLFGRIITISDVYDALSSARVYRPVPISQDRALGIMLEGSGKDFDPILLKWFINMIGIYPVGTLLELSDGHMGIVTKSRVESDPKRPQVVLVLPDKKGGYDKGPRIDLSKRDSGTGKYLRTIVQSHNPSQKGIKTVDFLL